ncbi:AAA family ATPase [Candidatus Bathyarchaeota archaeon]|nr:AAA family ATPase [Candidatus Bathyarchaeota archaeon]
MNNWKFTLKKQALHLPTQLLSLDRIMGGGIPKANLTLIYGEANTGKSSLALQCAVISAKHNLKTIIIDSDNNFSPTRLSQIANYNLNHISPLIFIFKPQSFNEQSLLIEHLDDYISNDVILIIVDTITSHYRLELGQMDKIFSLNRDLNRQIAYLANIAKTHNIAVLLISQVRDVFKNGKQQVEPVANRILKFWAQTILNSRMTNNPAIREVLIEKPSITKNVDARCLFMINKTGIIDLDIQTP